MHMFWHDVGGGVRHGPRCRCSSPKEKPGSAPPRPPSGTVGDDGFELLRRALGDLGFVLVQNWMLTKST
eukprot:539657-Pyramimonas_sp.AAC.1